jgi:hypothetical protein
MGAGPSNDEYIDKQAVADEVAYARRLSAKFNWAQLDVTRRTWSFRPFRKSGAFCHDAILDST